MVDDRIHCGVDVDGISLSTSMVAAAADVLAYDRYIYLMWYNSIFDVNNSFFSSNKKLYLQILVIGFSVMPCKFKRMYLRQKTIVGI